jgi:hypothetical protein
MPAHDLAFRFLDFGQPFCIWSYVSAEIVEAFFERLVPAFFRRLMFPTSEFFMFAAGVFFERPAD